MLNKSRLAVALTVVALAFPAVVLFLIPSYDGEPVSLQGLTRDDYYMTMAFAEIGKMTPKDGWPVGAVVVRDDKIIGRGSNRLFASNNPTQHAEYIAIDNAIEEVKRRHPAERYTEFFKDAAVYVTLEPCAMDAGKIILSRFKKVVICDLDEDWGTFGSVNNLTGYPHNVEVSLSGLPICEKLRQREGWNFEELWDYGKGSAKATNQVPSLLDGLIKKLGYQLSK